MCCHAEGTSWARWERRHVRGSESLRELWSCSLKERKWSTVPAPKATALSWWYPSAYWARKRNYLCCSGDTLIAFPFSAVGCLAGAEGHTCQKPQISFPGRHGIGWDTRPQTGLLGFADWCRAPSWCPGALQQYGWWTFLPKCPCWYCSIYRPCRHAVSFSDMLAISNDCLSVDMWSCTYSTVVLFFLPCLRRACMETVHSPIYTWVCILPTMTKPSKEAILPLASWAWECRFAFIEGNLILLLILIWSRIKSFSQLNTFPCTQFWT